MDWEREAIRLYPTPFYLYDQKIIERQLGILSTGKPNNLEIFYAMKGNSNLSILRFFKDQGIGTEIASGGELFLAKQAGFKPSDIIFTGPSKSETELEEAVRAGIRTIHIESLTEAKRLNAICTRLDQKQDILIRINAKFEVKTKVQLSGIPGPFGIMEEDIPELLPEILKLEKLGFKGIHVYNASGILDHTLLLQNMYNVFVLVRDLEQRFSISIPVIDFGGGLGIDYSDRDQPVNITAFYKGMEELIHRFGFEDRAFIMEIARFLIAESGTYITRVTDKKYSRGSVFLITDGGIQHFMRTVLFGENHSAVLIQNTYSAEKEIVTVTGNLCTSIDVLLKEVELPKAEIGDWILIRKAGCYSLNGAINHFLSHEMPAEVLIAENKLNLIRARSSYDDLLLNQYTND